jgi:ABC-type glycerol-3-phosphate transport system substrate-binding protein
LTACGSQAGSTGNGTESPSGNDAAASGEVETVSVLFPTFATTNSDEETEKIEAAVNQYLADKGYALCANCGLASTYQLIYNKEYTDAIGYDMSTVTDMASLEDLMAALKASGTDKIIMADTMTLGNWCLYLDDTATVGSYAATVGDSTELVEYQTSTHTVSNV